MKTYLITYYLKEHHSDCGCGDEHHHHHRSHFEITGEIKELGSWAHLMPTSFLVKSTTSSTEIKEKLEKVLEAGDMLFVTEVDKNNAASTTPGVVEWLSQN
ncbi:MAG: hypothetical protein ACRC2K_05970 [Clostridium sp.]